MPIFEELVAGDDSGNGDVLAGLQEWWEFGQEVAGDVRTPPIVEEGPEVVEVLSWPLGTAAPLAVTGPPPTTQEGMSNAQLLGIGALVIGGLVVGGTVLGGLAWAATR